ncbi:hypothetical protein EN35_32780 [Rhodococcus qingshengii]|nr:hypothetical protein EN35_32780 [Rhodococcus qingshengii]
MTRSVISSAESARPQSVVRLVLCTHHKRSLLRWWNGSSPKIHNASLMLVVAAGASPPPFYAHAPILRSSRSI